MNPKRKTGTREWSEHSYNIGIGCSHDCRYCYAKSYAHRYGWTDASQPWTTERLKDNPPPITKKKGWTMFPTGHDITEFYLEPAIKVLREILEKGNKVLIVSKPHIQCVAEICHQLECYRTNMLFRFTIGTLDESVAKFWEPGAPSIKERIGCLKYAWEHGFATSVSMEPMLGTVVDTLDAFYVMEPYVTDKIWIGKMNKIDRRVKKENRQVEIACKLVLERQSDEKIMWLVDQLKDQPKVAWKDSIQEVMEKHEKSYL